jgi:hypothetical protein
MGAPLRVSVDLPSAGKLFQVFEIWPLSSNFEFNETMGMGACCIPIARRTRR